MTFDPGLKHGQVIDNKELCSVFKCTPQMGMRRSLKTNTLLIISNHMAPYYDDVWEGDVLHYTGMGLTGDQDINFYQNKTLAESETNNVDLHLLEVYEKGKYIYQGRIKLAEKPYQKIQTDYQGGTRKVWMFPLKLVEGIIAPIPSELLKKNIEIKEKEIRKLSYEELMKKAEEVPNKPVSRPTIANQTIRSPIIAELAKRRAKGKCQLCNNDAPFKDRYGDPFLESHHIKWVSDNGEDTLKNTVALCPNCHRKIHILNLVTDIQYLLKQSDK